MKSNVLPAGFPATPEAWEKLIAQALEQVQDPDCPYDPTDPAATEAYWRNAVVVRAGGLPAVRAALAAADPARRAPPRPPAKVAVTVRYSPEVVDYFRATGTGWQARMDAVLRDYVAQHQG